MSAGTVFTELDLDFSKFERSQYKLLQSARAASTSVEKNWQNLGVKSDNIFAASRASIENSYKMIVSRAGTSAAEIVRAEEAKNAKLQALTEQQFGKQTSLIQSLKSHWIAASVAVVGAWALVDRAINFGKNVASSLNDIERQSKLIGVSTDQWQKWTYAAKMSDVSTDALMQSQKALAMNIVEAQTAGSEADRMFKALGITETDLSGVTLQVADRFSKWKDGADKINWGQKLLGKTILESLPFYNQSAEAIKAWGEEAEKAARIMGKDLIEAGGRADASFKRFEASMVSLKAASIPLIEVFASILEKTSRLATVKPPWWLMLLPGGQLLGLQGLMQNQVKSSAIFKMDEGGGIVNPPPFPGAKPGAGTGPKIGDAYKGYLDSLKTFYEDQDKLMEDVTQAETERVEKAYKERLKIIEEIPLKLVEAEAARNDKKKALDIQISQLGLQQMNQRLSMEKDYQMKTLQLGEQTLAKQLEGLAIQEQAAIAAAEKIGFSTKKVADYYAQLHNEILGVGTALQGIQAGFQRYTEESGTEYTRMKEATYNISKAMEDNFSSFFDNVLFEGKSFSDSMISLFQNLSRSIIDEMMKAMIVKPLVASLTGGLSGLFGNIIPGAGGIGAGAEWAPLTSSMGGFHMTAGGFSGIVSKPTLFLAGEKGKENVNITPEGKMEKGANTIRFTNVNFVDPKLFSQFLATSEGGRAMVNWIGANARTVMRILR